jgi:hypothetical protein
VSGSRLNQFSKRPTERYKVCVRERFEILQKYVEVDPAEISSHRNHLSPEELVADVFVHKIGKVSSSGQIGARLLKVTLEEKEDYCTACTHYYTAGECHYYSRYKDVSAICSILIRLYLALILKL